MLLCVCAPVSSISVVTQPEWLRLSQDFSRRQNTLYFIFPKQTHSVPHYVSNKSMLHLHRKMRTTKCIIHHLDFPDIRSKQLKTTAVQIGI